MNVIRKSMKEAKQEIEDREFSERISRIVETRKNNNDVSIEAINDLYARVIKLEGGTGSTAIELEE